MRRLIGCICLILLLVAPLSFEYTGQRQIFSLFQYTGYEERSVIFSQNETVVYHAIYNVFYKMFNNPCETIVFLTWQGTLYVYTNQMADRVTAPIGVVNADLQSQGQELADVILVVHNHFACPVFSPRDIRSYYYLKNKGFTGVFALWDSAQNRMVNRLPVKK